MRPVITLLPLLNHRKPLTQVGITTNAKISVHKYSLKALSPILTHPQIGGILNENMENSSNLFAFPELSDGNTLGSDFSTSSNVFPDFNSTMMSSNSLVRHHSLTL